MKTSDELEKSAALQVAALMAAAARTAPKTRGIDNIKTAAIEDEPTKQRVIARMRELAAKEDRPSFARDAANIERSPALVVIGVESNTAGLNCGFCGQPSCEALEEQNGVCTFNSIDLGIATAFGGRSGRSLPRGQPHHVLHRPRVPGPGNLRAESQTSARNSPERDRQKPVL